MKEFSKIEHNVAQEKVESAAVCYNGKIYKASTHAMALLALGKEHRKFSLEEIQQGFITSKGRFVDREQAEVIAKNASQTSVEENELHSENLKNGV